MSLISKFRSRRAIKNKLDEVARIFNDTYTSSSSSSSSRGLHHHFLSETDCAIVTDEGDILTRKSGTSTKPFSEVAPKVGRLRATSEKVAYALNTDGLQVLHIRGSETMLSTYALGSHTLVAISYLRDIHMDAAIERIDTALKGSNLIPQLARLVVI